MEIHIKLFVEQMADLRIWVASCQPGGPDLVAQGKTPEEALERLALTMRAERQVMGRGLEDIPTW